MMADGTSSPLSSRTAAHELAIARSLLLLLEESLADADVPSAADLAEQLAAHLRRLDEGEG